MTSTIVINPTEKEEIIKSYQAGLINQPFSVTLGYPHNYSNLTQHFIGARDGLIIYEWLEKKKKDRILGSLFNEGSCYVSANRGRLVHNFLNYSQDTHLLMIDPDISFTKDILDQFKKLTTLYPEAGIIAARVDIRNGLPVFYYNHPDMTSTIQYCFPFYGVKEFDFVGTGIILISRKVLFDLYTKLSHTHLFNMIIEPGTNRLLGDDLAFCKLARENGHKVYGCWEIFGQHFKEFPVPSRYPSAEDVRIRR